MLGLLSNRASDEPGEMAKRSDPAAENPQDRSDLVAYWSIPLTDGVHTVEFEHGTTSGKRVIRVDGQVRFFY